MQVAADLLIVHADDFASIVVCRDMRALWKKLKAEQSALDKKEAQMYSKAFQRMAQASDTKQQKPTEVSQLTRTAFAWQLVA